MQPVFSMPRRGLGLPPPPPRLSLVALGLPGVGALCPCTCTGWMVAALCIFCCAVVVVLLKGWGSAQTGPGSVFQGLEQGPTDSAPLPRSNRPHCLLSSLSSAAVAVTLSHPSPAVSRKPPLSMFASSGRRVRCPQKLRALIKDDGGLLVVEPHSAAWRFTEVKVEDRSLLRGAYNLLFNQGGTDRGREVGWRPAWKGRSM